MGFVGEDSLPTLRQAIDTCPFEGPFLAFAFAPRGTRRRHYTRFKLAAGQVLSVSHADVSGVTTFSGHFLAHRFGPLELEGGVPMTLGSIIDHKVYLPEHPAVSTLLTPADRLPVDSPLSLILLPSRFSPSGFGARSLTPRELLLAWDFPLWAPAPRTRRHTVELLGLSPPLRILLQLSDAARRSLALSTVPLRGAPLPTLTSNTSDGGRTWLPSLGTWLSHDWIDLSLLTPKAAKADAAALPTHMWDKRVSLVFPCATIVLHRLRSFLFSCACRLVFRSFVTFMRGKHGRTWSAFASLPRQTGGVRFLEDSGEDIKERLPLSEQSSDFTKDIVVGRLALVHFMSSSWWKWDKGSTPLFWRWPDPSSQRAARDGLPFFIFKDRLPRYRSRSKRLKPDTSRCLAEKVGDLLDKHYIDPTPSTISQIDFFAVPKVVGPDGEVLDVRLVFNGTSCGLNNALWAPGFWLPTPDTALRKLDFTSLMVDFDMGEFFLNFFLPYEVRNYAGVLLAPIGHDLSNWTKISHQEHTWQRLLFGLGPSPYNSIRFYYHAEEFVVGNPRERDNPLRWDSAVLNLPGNADFDPRKPWVYLWDAQRECIAGSIVTFVDDGRGSGSSVEHAWQLLHRAATRFQYLGLQVAIRKIRPPAVGCPPGAWAGMIAEATHEGIFKTVAQAKWDKAKLILDRIYNELPNAEGLEFKQLERDRGFLIHLAATYKAMTPYLKGIHLTLDSWRANRRSDGWKMSPKEWAGFLAGVENPDLREQLADLGNADHPPFVHPVDRLEGDLDALRSFFQQESPSRVCVRPSRFIQVVLGFGDASGNGFGGTFLSTAGLSYQIGVWKYRGTSSCSFEFRNLLDSLRREGEAGRLTDSFVLMMTDNQPVEEALFKGTSASKSLLQMVQEFHALEMEFGFVALVCHCSGKRMIAQGTDGLSRGGLNEGVMGGKSMLTFVPLHLSAFQRTPLLEPWVRSWTGRAAVFLSHEDWFLRGHDIVNGTDSFLPTEDGSNQVPFWKPVIEHGVLVWSPPPAAADVALEELRKARIKRQLSLHVILIPRLCTPAWLRQLFKASDIILEIPPGAPFWPSDMYEPLFVGILLPFSRFEPWSLRFSPKVLSVKRKLQKMWSTAPLDTGDILHEFVSLGRRVPTMSRRVVRDLLFFGQC
eukprot:scaffold8770_cov167-Cylindrotheca_fusiformis.AAC.2